MKWKILEGTALSTGFQKVFLFWTSDRDVPILVYAPGTVQHGSYDQPVETTQVAPTILALLGLNQQSLQAVQIEGTQVLPGLKHR